MLHPRRTLSSLTIACLLIATSCGGSGGGGGAQALASTTAAAGVETVLFLSSGAAAGTSVTIPADAVSPGTLVEIFSGEDIVTAGFGDAGLSSVRIELSEQPSQSATVVLPFDPAKVAAAGASNANLALLKESSGVIETIEQPALIQILQ